MIDFNGKKFRDKIMGCWMGKNCGGTLGEPLEKTFGEKEPFNINWYPELKKGGMPNDDLELQLIWLKALEEVGPGLKARDLARYWSDNIGYNWDEYGLSKTNLNLGLLPPASGAYNNWFKDMMGCPIRSEIWACIAPGAPRLAVKYAYEDAITDHAGGESVWGEFFNTAIESAAFIETDANRLLDIGRSYVPDTSKTAKAIDVARAAHKKGKTWLEARNAVLKATPHPVAQYSPINMGIQVIGMLYGRGFGHTLCLCVNCGYDTDCTAATVGSIYGIMRGYKALPKKWVEPLGDTIATNESWGGIKNVTGGKNPIPKNLGNLTDRTIAMTKKVMSGVTISKKNLKADASVFELVKTPAMSVFFPAPELDTRIVYDKDPVIVPGQPKKVTAHLTNSHPDARTVDCSLSIPAGWTVSPKAQQVTVPGGKTQKVAWTFKAKPAAITNTNRCTLVLDTPGYPAPPAVPFTLVGARALQMAGPYKATAVKPLDTACAPDTKKGKKRGGRWTAVTGRENMVPKSAFTGPGITYLRLPLNVLRKTIGRVRVEADCPFSYYIDGKKIVQHDDIMRIRPAQHPGGGRPFTKGLHEVLVKLFVSGKKKPEVHITLTTGNKMGDGPIDAEWTKNV